MISFHYRARDKFGKVARGVIIASSEEDVVTQLKQAGYIPVVIVKMPPPGSLQKFFRRFSGVRFVDLNIFTRQLFTLQRAGIPLLSALIALQEQATNLALKDVIARVIKGIEAGMSLSGAFAAHPKVFSVLYVNMIKSGEASGRLEEILERLAFLGEHEEKVRQRIKSAIRYPLMVVVAICIAFLVLITFVIPRFAVIYSQFTVTLPLPTRVLLLINHIVVYYWWVITIFVIAVAVFFWRFVKTKKGRVWWDGLILKTPIFGLLLLKIILSRFTRVTGILLRSGVGLLEILELTQEGVGNVVVARVIDNVRDSVNAGRGMSEPIRISGMFPAIVVQMVAVGENSGKLDELLLYVSDYYDSEVDYTVDNLVSLIEPILIIFLGCAVLFMALGIFLPMWNLMSLFRR